MMKYSAALIVKNCVLLMAIVVLFACSELSETGAQNEFKPVANAIVVGFEDTSAEGMGGLYSVRAGSEVLLSGKDSNGIDDPILQFSWLQTDNSGIEVVLIERGQNARSFTAPLVSIPTQLNFELTVIDADGVEAADVITVEVIPVYDTDGFLVHPDTNKAQLTLLVSPNDGEVTGSLAEEFDIEITTIAHWRNRLGEYDSTTLSKHNAVLRGSFPALYTATSNIDDVKNPRLEFPLPQVNVDEINQLFEATDRHRRLEIHDIDSAYLELQIELKWVSTSVAFKVYAYDGVNLLASDKVTLPLVSGDAALRSTYVAGEDETVIENDAAVLIDSDENGLITSIYVEELKQQLGVGNVQSGRNYYNLIDPEGEFVYLRDWLLYAGFVDADGELLYGDNIAHAVYVNSYDLGFGRDMWTRVTEDGDVYSYVVNYPNLESAVKKIGDFAVVVMEYSANPNVSVVDEDDLDTESSEPEKIVKFYSYVPDQASGGYIRANTMNFDGRGEKAMPGVCTACHYQDPDTIDNTFVDASGEPDFSQADLGATFLPWDLDSFLYSSAESEGQVDPSYNSQNVLASNTTISNRAGQEAQFKKLNEAALATYVDNPERHRASIDLVHCMYGDTTRQELDAVLPGDTFDSDCIQTGWVEQEELYHKVYARHCRACHTQFPTHDDDADTEIDFDSYSDFSSEDKTPILINYVYELGIMPMARLTMDRFWLNYQDESTSAADFLRAHLVSIGEQVSSVPGQPVAAAEINGNPNSVGDTVTVNGSESVFSDVYHWEIMVDSELSDGDCLTGPEFEHSESAVTQIVFDSDAYFPCVFNITLTTRDSAGLFSNSITHQVVTDRVPVASSYVVNLTEVGYQLGDDQIFMDVVDKLEDVGDGGVTIVVNQTEAPYELEVNESVESLNDTPSVLVFSYDALQGIDDIFEYKAEDVNGSVSVAETQIQVIIPELKPVLISDLVLSTRVDFSWTWPSGFLPASGTVSYDVFIKKQSDVAFPDQASATTVLTVASVEALDFDTNYLAKIRVTYNGYVNESEAIAVATSPGVPLNLSVTSRTSSRIDLSWSPPSESSGVCYKVYRNGSVVSGANCLNVVIYADTGLSSNTNYTYQIAGVDISATEALTQALVTETNAVAPTDLSVISVEAKSVTLRWTDSNDGLRDFLVYRNSILVDTVSDVSGTPDDWVDSGLTTNTSYSYAVATRGESGVISDLAVFGSIETDVTYADNIRPGPVAREGCINCHSSHTEINIENYFKNEACVTANAVYGSCSLSMGSQSFSASDFSLIEKWLEDGAQ